MGSRIARLRKDQCAHEAGHAVAWWYFGHQVDSLEVVPRKRRETWKPGGAAATLGQVRGTPIVFERTSSEMGFQDDELREWYHATGIVRAEIQLVVIAAGPVAEAEQSRRTENGIWTFGGGANDYVLAKSVALRWLEGDPEHAIDKAIVRAKALLRSDRGRRAVAALTEELANTAILDGKRTDAICWAAFGGSRPAFQAWIEAWPPDLTDLNAGWVISEADARMRVGATSPFRPETHSV